MYEIIKEVIEACDNNITQLDYEEEGLHFLIRNVGKGKVIYLEKGYHDEPTKMKFEDYGVYKDGIFYFTDSYWLLKQRGSKYDREGSEEEAVKELNGKLFEVGIAFNLVENQIKAHLEYLNSKREIPNDIDQVSKAIKYKGEAIAFDIALKGESEKIAYTINHFELSRYDFESIFFEINDVTVEKVAEEYYFKDDNQKRIYNEQLAYMYSNTLDYSTLDVVKMYKALSSADMKTVNATIKGNGCKETYKLNVEMLCYDIAYRRDLSITTFTCQSDERECMHLMNSNSNKNVMPSVYPNQITKITYGKKVIYEKEA